jgi:thiamine biosynthesis lipoprotein
MQSGMQSGIQSVHNNGLLYAWFSAMHTRIDLLLHGKPETELQSLTIRISETLQKLEKLANYFDSASELCRVNNEAHQHPVTVSDDLFRILSLCKTFNLQTEGCFDITIQSDHYHEKTAESFHLDETHSSVFFDSPGIRLDLSGFLKGYALDQAKTILKNQALPNALINFGNSSVMALGNHPNGEGWKVSVAASHEEFLLHDECLTTSGNDSTGRKHIISPQTGKYVEGRKSVSVVTPDGAWGEALSIALFIATPEQKERILKNVETRYSTSLRHIIS